GDLRRWAYGVGKPINWLTGPAGTGKTAVAYSFCAELERNKRLGASFFCCGTSHECEDVSRILPTIAHQLANRSYPFKDALCRILGETQNIAHRNIEAQLEYLIKIPLLETKESLPKHLVIVIDAPEECSDLRSMRHLLDILFQCVRNLPIKIFLSSRPDPSIMNSSLINESCRMVCLHEIEKQHVKSDILTFLSVRLSDAGLPENALKQMAEESGELFAYAATLARYIISTEPGADKSRRLEAVLGHGMPGRSTGYRGMDDLYRVILEPFLLIHDKMSANRVAEVEDLKQAFWTVLCAREPLPKATLVALTGRLQSWDALSWFRSVLHVSGVEAVSIIHASLPEFIFSTERSGPLVCNKHAHNAYLAKGCFDVMKKQLVFNIGRFTTSCLFDKDVPQLEATLLTSISPELSYACRHWAEHLKRSCPREELLTCLREFLDERLFFWMEVVNLKGWMNYGPGTLMKAQNWVAHAYGEGAGKTRKFLHDACSFVTAFAANPVCQSTPHIYPSLMFISRNSEVWHRYSALVDNHIQVDGTIVRQREGAALATTIIGACVTALAYSPDGVLIAVGTADGDIRLSHTYDCSRVLNSFKAHSSRVNSLAFFPDGDLILSGSQDCTVGVWDIGNFARGQPPQLVRLQKHELPVNSIAIASDGTHFASASDDKTIRLWDLHDHDAPARLLEGHDGGVTSIQISPDSKKLVSGSRDFTVRVWDLSNAKLTDTLQGHEGCVTSVIFSADGKCVTSGSIDGTIREWDIHPGRAGVLPQIFDSFGGHLGGISYLALSSDGKRIVSAGQDRKLLMWDACHGRQIAGPFDGHTGDITALAFSPDDAHVASGSLDRTAKLWDARQSTIFSKLSQGHTNGVTSIASSPDGTLIASGSRDHTIRIWASSDGTSYSGPFIGHNLSVTSIAFSNNKVNACLRLVSGSQDRTVRVWNVWTGTLLFDLIGHGHRVNSAVFSPNDTLIASGSEDRTIRLWDPRKRAPVGNPLRGHENSVTSLAFSGDGCLLVSGSWDQTILIWDVRDGTRIAGPFHGHTDVITCVAFSPDQRLVVSGSWDRKIHVWSLADGTRLPATFEGHTDGITSLALSADGAYLVSGSSDHQIRVWSMSTGRPLTAPLKGHTDHVTSVAFLPDEMRIVSGSLDQTIRVWQVSDGNEQRAWAVNQLGWITEHPSNLVLYPPADLRDIVPRPPNTLTIYPYGSISISSRSGPLNNLWRGPNVPGQAMS
ncbi:hypothetical protein FRC11_014828, partial [Ceratobasidium sp. 423]